MSLPERASVRSPASPAELEWLHAALGEQAGFLESIYRISNGFESVIRGGELHLQLWQIRDFEFHSDDVLIIGSDSEAADVALDVSESPVVVFLQNAFGPDPKERLENLCLLSEFAEWICASGD